MSQQSNDTQYLRCLRCLKIIKCSRYDTNCMVRHVQSDHPEIISSANEKVQNLHKLAAEHGVSEERLSQISKMTGMSEAEMAVEAERCKWKSFYSAIESGLKCMSNFIAILCPLDMAKRKQGKRPSVDIDLKQPHITDSKDLSRRHYYRSSIERWTPIDGCIYCPSCGSSRRPVIKSSSEFYASTGCGAACVANCWPFCFLPCLAPADNREYLHCSNCKTFLGIYDRENNCIRPNREFVPH
ncbi:hypothetical protein KR222_006066 [Zaprionus bogoriensis]|nr:hypothetical protein KR222_006066 [Zaprionus bogoriensis]